MELANQIFYLTISMVALGLVFPAYVNLHSSIGTNNDSRYWLCAVIAQFISALAFSAYPILGKAGLMIGSASQHAVDAFLVLLFISYRKTVSRATTILVLLTIAIVPWFQLLDYAYRVMAQMFTLLAFSFWQLYELNKVKNKNKSVYILYIMAAVGLQMLLGALRIDHAFQYIDPVSGVSIPHNRFDEPEHELIIRLSIVAIYLLTIVAVGNYHFVELWKESQRNERERKNQMLHAMNALAAARDNETGKHTLRTQHFARALAKDLMRHGQFADVINDTFIETLFHAAPLHDIGKVGIPDHILLKEGRHTSEESKVMQTHTVLGVGILNAAKSEHEDDVINKAIVIAGTHHERWDGSGYPSGLSGVEIPLSGRIMAIADVYDALTTRRHYKDSWSHKDATEEIVKNRGIHFDPVIVDAFERVNEEFEQISEGLRDEISNSSGPEKSY